MTDLFRPALSVFDWVLHTSWQAAVLAGIILLVQWLLRAKLSAAWRHGLWFLLIVRLLIPATPHSPTSVFNLTTRTTESTGSFAPAGPVAAASRPPVVGQAALPATSEPESLPANAPLPNSPDADVALVDHPFTAPSVASIHPSEGPRIPAGVAPIDWRRTAMGVWLAGVGILLLRLVLANLRFLARLSTGSRVTDPNVLLALESARTALGLRRAPRLIAIDCVASPAVYGGWRRRLLVPEGFVQRFSREELRQIFLHELAHLKRRDLEVNWLVSLLQILHWFNPVLWFAFRRLRADRELAADALALSCISGEEHTTYGETLLKVLAGLGRRPVAPGLVGIAEDRARIRQRIESIAQHAHRKPWTWQAASGAVLVAAVALTDGAPQQPAPDAPPQNPILIESLPSLPDSPGMTRGGPRRLSLRFLDFDTGAPVRDLSVEFELQEYGAESIVVPRTADESGRAALELDPTNLQRVAYRTKDSRFLTIEGEWLKHETATLPESLDVKMSAGVEIGGSVVDEAGNPVAGAEILVAREVKLILQGGGIGVSGYPVMWTQSAGTRLAITDAAGHWKARSLWPTANWAELRIRHRDFAEVHYSTRITRAMEMEGRGRSLAHEDLSRQTARFVLSTGATVRGRVEDATHRAWPGIPVRYGEWDDESHRIEAPIWERTVTTDAEGRFEIKNVPRRRQYFAVQAPGSAPVTRSVDGPDLDQEPLILTVSPAPGLVAQIVDAAGAPVAEARVRYLEWGIWRGIRWETQSDREGRIAWPEAPAERFRLRIEKEGFLTHNQILAGAPEEQHISLKRALQISGPVTDAITGQPVPSFRITWSDREEYLRYRQGQALRGSEGRYLIDLGRLQERTWAEGYAHEFVFRIEAEGYQAVTSRKFSARNGDVGELTYPVQLEPGGFIEGIVLGPDGNPLSGAQVAVKAPITRLRLTGRPHFEDLDGIRYPETDAAGRFRLTSVPDATHLVAVHELGVAWVASSNLTEQAVLRLQPWGRVEGTVWEYDQPVANQDIWHHSSLLQGNGPGLTEFVGLRGKSDEQGRFAFAYVPPGEHRFYRMIPLGGGSSSSGPAISIEVPSGETASVKIGGLGRPVLGRFKIANPYVEIDWQKGDFRMGSVLPRPPVELKTREEFDTWREQDDIKQAYAALRNHPLKMAGDGLFRIENVVPGRYQFSVRILDPRDPDAFAYSRHVANYQEVFEVPDSPQRDSREPLDLGEFEIVLKPQIESGKTVAPAFTVPDLDGQQFSLADFKGRYVLLDFWATWCAPCIAELPYLRAVQEKFGERDDFVMIGLSLDDEPGKPRTFVAANQMPWRQGFLGREATTHPVAANYGVSGIPAKVLIDPQGRIVATDLPGVSLVQALDKWLK